MKPIPSNPVNVSQLSPRLKARLLRRQKRKGEPIDPRLLPKKKMGKKRVNHEFDIARQLVQAEQLGSITQFDKWWMLNKPAKIPKRPDRAYIKEWVSWNDFLGNNNKFKERGSFRSYEDAKIYAHKLKITSFHEWLEFSKSGKRPADIPGRPDIYYRTSGKWHTWKEFLGYENIEKIHAVAETKEILFIFKPPTKYNNIYKINKMHGGLAAFKDLVIANPQMKLVAAFECENDDWIRILNACSTKYTLGAEDEYAFKNVFEFISEVSNIFRQIRL